MGELLFLLFCLFRVSKVFIYIKKVKGFFRLLALCPTCRAIASNDDFYKVKNINKL